MDSSNSYFFSNIASDISSKLINELRKYAEDNKKEVYCLSAPMMEEKYSYNYKNGWSLLIPEHPIIFIYDRGSHESFEEYVEDYLEDLSHIADKFNFASKLGRTRTWSKYYTTETSTTPLNVILEHKLTDDRDKRIIDVFISLILGCYNDASKIEIDCGDNLLDKIKNKILLFDCNQTRFLYSDPPKKDDKITYIQGLAGTGKTELLLHKLKNLYLKEDQSIFGFTCYNKVLASVLRSRIPQFFNQMGANKQIDWNGNMVCAHAWGSWSNPRSGILSYICDFYHLPWYSLSDVGTFEKACEKTLNNLKEKNLDKSNNLYCFTYMFIDESQDFPKSFIDLCGEVTEKRVYAAGDIFQNIFTVHKPTLSKNTFQILLNQCYRTDPRTFMFAHAMGLGLLERKKINWLTDEDWKKCGYEIQTIEEGRKYRFSRRPIRRFEDLGNDYPPMKIYKAANYMGGIVKEINEWKEQFPNITPDDIAIIFLDNDKNIYDQASKIADNIKRKYGWDTNIAYITKRKKSNSIFISNRNNVKGLEFPFVFCLTAGIKNDMVYRHTLYTMLSRSHVRSVLIFSDTKQTLLDTVQEGINDIMSHGYMTVSVPTKEEQKAIQMEINSESERHSLEERINSILITETIPYEYWENIKSTLSPIKESLVAANDSQLTSKIKIAWSLIQPE